MEELLFRGHPEVVDADINRGLLMRGRGIQIRGKPMSQSMGLEPVSRTRETGLH